MVRIIDFQDLAQSDLLIDAVYEGGQQNNVSDDPISKLLTGVGNQGGFRAAGVGDIKRYVVLYTSGEDSDWPDEIDLSTGQFTYFGDNKTPGHRIDQTTRGGNKLLEQCFDKLHAVPPDRASIPPFFVFQRRATDSSGWSVQFRGLAIPGFHGLTANQDLVAVWRTTAGERFQNYRSVFTILDVPVISRSWINDLAAGEQQSSHAPQAWREWREKGVVSSLVSAPTKIIRSEKEQIPDTKDKQEIVLGVYEHFKDAPTSFEAFAARVFEYLDQRVIVDEVTRGVKDGGRDAIGRYLLGLKSDPVFAEFALEAKCYRPPINGMKPTRVRVGDTSRLISRIRNRQFGVLVTTSVVAKQAYEEVRDDKHPIILISGRDIADILIQNGYNTVDRVRELLNNEFSH